MSERVGQPGAGARYVCEEAEACVLLAVVFAPFSLLLWALLVVLVSLVVLRFFSPDPPAIPWCTY